MISIIFLSCLKKYITPWVKLVCQFFLIFSGTIPLIAFLKIYLGYLSIFKSAWRLYSNSSNQYCKKDKPLQLHNNQLKDSTSIEFECMGVLRICLCLFFAEK